MPDDKQFDRATSQARVLGALYSLQKMGLIEVEEWFSTDGEKLLRADVERMPYDLQLKLVDHLNNREQARGVEICEVPKQLITPLPSASTRRFIPMLTVSILAILGVIGGMCHRSDAGRDASNPVEAAQDESEKILATVAGLLPERTRRKALGSSVDVLYERTENATTTAEVQRVTRSIARHMLTTAGRAHVHNARSEMHLPLAIRVGVLSAVVTGVLSSLITIFAFILTLTHPSLNPVVGIPLAAAFVILSTFGGWCLYKATVHEFPKASRKEHRSRRKVD